MNKTEIRKLYARKRKQLSGSHLEEMTAAIMSQFDKLNLAHFRSVLSYAPLALRNEFNVRLCESALRKAHDGISIAHPRIVHNSNFMEAIVVGHDTLFVENNYGLHEPAQGEVMTPESVDLVLVPLLAFDAHGFRVGYGKGFYDRWLAQCRPGTTRMGFSFFGPVESIDDINEFDVPLNLCITPMSVYEF